MTLKSKVPEIRFEGFSGEWEDEELGEIAKITMGQSPNGTNYTDNPEDYILVQGNADIKNGMVVPRIWTKQVTKTADVGDLIFSVRAPVGEVGKTTYNIVIGRGVAGIKGNEFIFQSLKRMNENGYWTKLSSGSTFDSINSTDLQTAIIANPIETEQTKIGTYFQHLDSLITQHQQKHEKLLNLKKAMLEKMFPKDGADVPEIRFEGFSGKWKEIELGEMADFSKGNGYSKNNLVKVGNPIILYGRLYTKYETIITEVDTFVMDNNNSIYSKGNEVIVPSSGETAEDIVIASAVVKEGIILGGDLNIIYPNNKLDSIFLALTISNGKAKKDLSKKAQGKSVVHLRNTDLKEVEIYYPKKNEQTKIGNFFKKLDDLIVLQQTKLKKLKNIKKASLEKMFV